MPCICEFCNNSLSTTASLIKHKKTNKKCLKIQRERSDNKEEIKSDEVRCDFCDKTYATKESFKHHVCKISKDRVLKLFSEISLLKGRISELETQNDKLLDKPRIINNITNKTVNSNSTKTVNNIDKLINVLSPFSCSPTYIQNVVNKEYKETYYNKGVEGVIEFIADHACMDEHKNLYYYPVDVSRRKFAYKDGNNNIKTENDGHLIFKNYIPPVKEKNIEYTNIKKIDKKQECSEAEKAKDRHEECKSYLESLLEDYNKNRTKIQKEMEDKKKMEEKENEELIKRKNEERKKKHEERKKRKEKKKRIEEGEDENNDFWNIDRMDHVYSEEEDEESEYEGDINYKIISFDDDNKINDEEDVYIKGFKIIDDYQRDKIKSFIVVHTEQISACEEEIEKYRKAIDKLSNENTKLNTKLDDKYTMSSKLAKHIRNKIDISIDQESDNIS